MNMNVRVPIPIMNVFMHVDVPRQRVAKPPDADANEHHAHATFRPTGQGFQRQHFAKQKRQRANDDDPGGVAQSPPKPGEPRSRTTLDRERGDCGEVIHSRKDVNHSSSKCGDDDGNHKVSAFRTIAPAWPAGADQTTRPTRLPESGADLMNRAQRSKAALGARSEERPTPRGSSEQLRHALFQHANPI